MKYPEIVAKHIVTYQLEVDCHLCSQCWDTRWCAGRQYEPRKGQRSIYLITSLGAIENKFCKVKMFLSVVISHRIHTLGVTVIPRARYAFLKSKIIFSYPDFNSRPKQLSTTPENALKAWMKGRPLRRTASLSCSIACWSESIFLRKVLLWLPWLKHTSFTL